MKHNLKIELYNLELSGHDVKVLRQGRREHLLRYDAWITTVLQTGIQETGYWIDLQPPFRPPKKPMRVLKL